MSLYAGIWRFDDPRRDVEFLNSAVKLLSPLSPDGTRSLQQENLSIVYGGFCTTAESRNEVQPFRSPSGSIYMWDGQLDNRADLLRQFSHALTQESPDVSIVATAYEHWGDAAFAKLVGDWALAVWDSRNRFLILAKDVIGPRHLYWHISSQHVSWSTSLEIIQAFDHCHGSLNEAYIAGWLCGLPSPDLTPYSAVHSVHPGFRVRVRPGTHDCARFYNFDSTKRIQYRADREYEEHFRAVFCESVRRRLRSDRPVLAELSGGMDSSSIVCLADTLIANGQSQSPRLDTVSFYDSTEPNWNELPYFSIVEQKRGRHGQHIDVSQSNMSVPGLRAAAFGSTPCDYPLDPTEAAEFANCLVVNGNRILLSGIGGDEVLGGVPSPVPELADHLARARFVLLGQRLVRWALAIRQPVISLMTSTCKSFLPRTTSSIVRSLPAGEWLRSEFVRRHEDGIRRQNEHYHLFAPLPSFQENLAALDSLQRQLECAGTRTNFPYQVRYPYLDRDLLEFLFAIPREQVLRPGQRRSLMRRALTGTVPREILERKRKAYILRGPMMAIARDWEQLSFITTHMLSADMGIVDAEKFRKVLLRIREGHAVPITPVFRTLLVENWLRQQMRMSDPKAAEQKHPSTQLISGYGCAANGFS